MAIYGNFSRKNTAAQIAAGTINASAKTITVNQQTYPDGTIFFGSDGGLWQFNGSALVKVGEKNADLSGYLTTGTAATTYQRMLSPKQMDACNSGITSAKVSTYDGYDSRLSDLGSRINTKAAAADLTALMARVSALESLLNIDK